MTTSFLQFSFICSFPKMCNAAVVGQTERARTMPQTDQRNVAPRAETHARIRRQLAQGQGSLRPATTGVGTGQRGCPKGRERGRVFNRTSLKIGQEEKDGRGCPPKGKVGFPDISIFFYLFFFQFFCAVPCHAWVGISFFFELLLWWWCLP